MLSKRQKMITALIAGVVAGGGLYFLYLLRAHTYLTDEPSACVNCHIQIQRPGKAVPVNSTRHQMKNKTYDEQSRTGHYSFFYPPSIFPHNT